MELDTKGQPIREGFQNPGQQPPRPQGNGPQPTTPAQVQASIDATPEPPPMESQPPAAPLEEWPIVVRLIHKPIRGNHNEEITELRFREPTGGDINRCGNPCRINFEGDVIIDEKKMSLI